MFNDIYNEEHAHFEDRLDEPLLEDIVEAELVKDDFVEDRVPEDRFDDAVHENQDSVVEDRLDWDKILENVEVEVPEDVSEDVVGLEIGGVELDDNVREDGVETDLGSVVVKEIKTDDLPPVELGDIVIEKRDDVPEYLTDSEDAYDQKVTLYDNNYDQVLEDAKKQEEAEKGYVRPRVERAWAQVKVRRGPRRYRSPVQSQETVFRGKGYVGTPKPYKR